MKLRLLFLTFFLMASPVWAVITLEDTNDRLDTNVNGFNFAYSFPFSENRCLVALLGSRSNTDANRVVSSITYNAVAMTLSQTQAATVGSDNYTVWIYYLAGVPEGQHTFDVTMAGTNGSLDLTLLALSGCDQDSQEDVSGKDEGTQPTNQQSISLTTTVDNTFLIDVKLDEQATSSRTTADSPQVQEIRIDFGSFTYGVSYIADAGTAGAETMSWTDTDDDESWIAAAIAIKDVQPPGLKVTDATFRTDTYVDYCADANTVGCYRFNSDVGYVVDESGDDAHGATVASPTYQTSGCSDGGNCWSFNGTTQYIDIVSKRISDADTTYTVCAWFNTNDITAHNGILIAQRDTSDTSDISFQLDTS